MQQHDASPLKEEKPRKQVHFKVDEVLGKELDLPIDCTHFLAESAAPEQGNAPSVTVRLPTPTRSPQHSPALAGGAWPKVLAAASSS